MGQYYKPVLVTDDGAVKSAYSHDYDSGLKLMEHSWVGNDFVNAVLGVLDQTPQRLAWVGDYALSVVEEYCNYGGGFITSRDEFEKYYQMVWGEEPYTLIDKQGPVYKLNKNDADCFVVNLTKGCYIDMKQYVLENTHDGWCINPVPLLTSIGNGQGGGDYRGYDEDYDVGSWAFDKIYVAALRPSDMEEVMYHFREE